MPGKWSTFRAISRGTYYKVHSVRDPPPPCGYYNINYELVDRASSMTRMHYNTSKSKKKSKKKKGPPLRYVHSVEKIKGYIDFKKQSPRSSFEKLQLANNPHEKSFETLELFPKIYSKAKHVPQIDFGKTRRRDSFIFKSNLTPSIYSPNYEYIKRSLSKTGVEFSKHLPKFSKISGY